MRTIKISADSRLPTEWVSPRRPRGASALSRPLRIFSSLGNGGKNKGGGGWPGSVKSGMFGGADVNALRLCAYARSSGYGIEAKNVSNPRLGLELRNDHFLPHRLLWYVHLLPLSFLPTPLCHSQVRYKFPAIELLTAGYPSPKSRFSAA